jgi:hypothetical protein
MGRAAWLLVLTACGAAPIGSVAMVPASTCASGQQWVGGSRESALMHPGVACISCHTMSREGPRFAVAGTVYQSYDEHDDCGGVSASGLEVLITGADGAVFQLPANSMGNFMLERTTVALPFSAKVVDANGGERAMQAKQTDGDCNNCHTAMGAQGAPGRIIAP